MTGSLKLFFVNPVGCAVDYFTRFTIFCYCYFGVEVEFFHVQVIVAGKSNVATVGRKERNFLSSVFRKRLKFFAFYVVHVIVGSKSASVSEIYICVHKNFQFIGAENVSGDVFYRTVLDLIYTKQCINSIACFVVVLYNRIIVYFCSKVLPIGHRNSFF